MAKQSRLEITIPTERALQSAPEFMDQLDITGNVFSTPELFIVAIQYGLGPSDKQSLGEWVADTISDARRRVAKNLASDSGQQPGQHRAPDTAENTQPASGDSQ